MPKFKKNTSKFRMKSPFRQEQPYIPMKAPFRQEQSTKAMMQNLDDKIAELKKLGKHKAAQVFIDKKSKLMDSTGKSSIATKKKGYEKPSMARKVFEGYDSQGRPKHSQSIFE